MTTSLRDKAIQTALVGDWKTAISTNKKLIGENPKDIDALNRLALALTILGKTTSAKTTYQKVLKIDPLNPIALRNLKNLKTAKRAKKDASAQDFQINNKFIEETGKTKVVELINIAQQTVIQNLRMGQVVNLSIKRSRIFVLRGEKQYIGVLPDDIGRRLIKFIKSGNTYEAYIKSVSPHKVIVFIKEQKRGGKYKNQPSFVSFQDAGLFDKNDRIKKQVEQSSHDLEEEEEEAEEEEEF